MTCGISDHAVMRACERILGIDVPGIQQELAAGGAAPTDRAVLAEIDARGLADTETVRAALVPVKDWVVAYGAVAARWSGLRFIVRGGCMITILHARVHPVLEA